MIDNLTPSLKAWLNEAIELPAGASLQDARKAVSKAIADGTITAEQFKTALAEARNQDLLVALHRPADAKPHPMLRIPAALEKGNQDRMLAVAPEFAEFLAAVPRAQRAGRVFNPAPRRGATPLAEHQIGKIISAIGDAAGVKVRSSGDEVKYASAHDLRRSFGERWARKPGVMPQLLMELMRHESIETTMRYYVGRNAQSTAAVLWESHKSEFGTNSGTIPENGGATAASTKPQTTTK